MAIARRHRIRDEGDNVIQLTQRRRLSMLSVRNVLRGGAGLMNRRSCPVRKKARLPTERVDTVTIPRRNAVPSSGTDAFFRDDDGRVKSIVASTS
jgi:hypothetical protein